MTNLIGIVLIAIVIALFWQQRRQSETARNYIERRCEQLNLQLISVARGNYIFADFKRYQGIRTRYYFEFSSDGMNCFQGYAVMNGNRVQEVYMPPYPI